MLKIITRWHSIVGFFLTVIAFLLISAHAEADQALLLRQSIGIDLSTTQVIYIGVMFLCLIGVLFEGKIKQVLQRTPASFFACVASAFWVVWLTSYLIPVQETRLFQTPVSLVVIILHGMSLAVLIVSLTGSKWMPEKLSVGILSLLTTVLIMAYIVSVGEFLQLDLPDEPWLASMATNFAENGDLSPSFIGSAFGSPDIILARYYGLMGYWLRAAGSSIQALRAFPLFMAALAVLLLAKVLWSIPLRTDQRISGIMTLLALSAFARMSHNLRYDILLAVYSSCLLLALVQLLRNKGKKWALLAGFSLIIGMDAIPFLSLSLGFATGMILIVRALRDKNARAVRLQEVAIFVGASALACLIFVAVRALPDLVASLENYRAFTNVYTLQTGIGTIHWPWEKMFDYHLRFSLILSPIEALLTIIAFVLLWRQGEPFERWMIAIYGLALLIVASFSNITYGYWTLWAPFTAYAVARSLNTESLRKKWLWVCVPMLIAPILRDMIHATHQGANQSKLEAVALFQSRIPVGSSLIGDDLLWFPLHSERNFIGWSGMMSYSVGHQLSTLSEAFERLDLDYAICSDQDMSRCDSIVGSGMFELSEELHVEQTTYYLYARR